jgi:hypothetical protein
MRRTGRGAERAEGGGLAVQSVASLEGGARGEAAKGRAEKQQKGARRLKRLGGGPPRAYEKEVCQAKMTLKNDTRELSGLSGEFQYISCLMNALNGGLQILMCPRIFFVVLHPFLPRKGLPYGKGDQAYF